MKARLVPYALKAKVEKELDRLQSEGITSPVEFTEWASHMVSVVKQDGSVRICGNYQCTVNQVSKFDNYPISKTEGLLATLGWMCHRHTNSYYCMMNRRNPLQSTLTRDPIHMIDCHSGFDQHLEFSKVQWRIYCKASPCCRAG